MFRFLNERRTFFVQNLGHVRSTVTLKQKEKVTPKSIYFFLQLKVSQDPCSLINSLAKFLEGVLSWKAVISLNFEQ